MLKHVWGRGLITPFQIVDSSVVSLSATELEQWPRTGRSVRVGRSSFGIAGAVDSDLDAAAHRAGFT
jgi:hypothetical protein